MTQRKNQTREFEQYKWTLLYDAYEDQRVIWEALGTVYSYFPDLPADVAEDMAIRALHELFQAGLIDIYWDTWMRTSTEPIESRRLAADEVDQLLASPKELRGKTVEGDDPLVFYIANDAGSARAQQLTARDIISAE